MDICEPRDSKGEPQVQGLRETRICNSTWLVVVVILTGGGRGRSTSLHRSGSAFFLHSFRINVGENELAKQTKGVYGHTIAR